MSLMCTSIGLSRAVLNARPIRLTLTAPARAESATAALTGVDQGGCDIVIDVEAEPWFQPGVGVVGDVLRIPDRALDVVQRRALGSASWFRFQACLAEARGCR